MNCINETFSKFDSSLHIDLMINLEKSHYLQFTPTDFNSFSTASSFFSFIAAL